MAQVSLTPPSRKHIITRFGGTHPLSKALVFIVIVLLSTVVRLANFPRFLPYNDHFDEPSMLLLARDWRGVEHIAYIPEWLAGYPPLYIWVNMEVQQLVETFFSRGWFVLGDYLYALRLLAAISGIVTTCLVMLLGWQIGKAVAAWFAGLFWGLSPVVVEHNNFAIPDPLLYFTCALTLNLVVFAWLNRQHLRRISAALLISLGTGLAAIYLKYSAVYVFIPWGMVLVVMLHQDFGIQSARRQKLVWVGLYTTIFLLAVGYLLFVYGAVNLNNNEAASIRGAGMLTVVTAMFDYQRLLHNLTFAIWPIGVGFFVGLVVLGVGATVLNRFIVKGQSVTSDWLIGALLLYTLGCLVITSAYFDLGARLPTDPRDITISFVRHVLPATIAFCVIGGAAVAHVTVLLQRLVSQHQSVQAFVPVVVGAVMTVLFGLEALPRTILNFNMYRLPDTRVITWQWADNNLPLDGNIALVRGEIQSTWNRYWGGYDGKKAFPWWFTDTLPSFATLQSSDLQQLGIAYVALTDNEYLEFTSNTDTQPLFQTLTPIKHIAASSTVYGPGVYIFRTFPPQRQVASVIFNDEIAFTGYDLDSTLYYPGDTVAFRPYWRAVGTPSANYSMFIHLYKVEEQMLITQYDGNPSQPDRLTQLWDDPDELIIGQQVSLTLPDDIQPGRYRFAVGLYNYATGERLKLANGDDHWSLLLTIQAP